jgi:hypothetical protein
MTRLDSRTSSAAAVMVVACACCQVSFQHATQELQQLIGECKHRLAFIESDSATDKTRKCVKCHALILDPKLVAEIHAGKILP